MKIIKIRIIIIFAEEVFNSKELYTRTSKIDGAHFN